MHCVCLIGVDVHSSSELGANANYYVAEDQAAIFALNLYADDLLIGYAKTFCIRGSQVDVTLCSDHALGELYLAGRSYQLARTGSGYVTALTNGTIP